MNGEQGIKSAVRAAQSDTHDTWIEKKLTKRPSMESFESYNEYAEARRQNQEELTRQTSFDLKKKKPPVAAPTSSKAPVAVPTSSHKPKPPPPAPKPRNSSLYTPAPPPPPEYSGALPAPVLVSGLSVVEGRTF